MQGTGQFSINKLTNTDGPSLQDRTQQDIYTEKKEATLVRTVKSVHWPETRAGLRRESREPPTKLEKPP